MVWRGRQFSLELISSVTRHAVAVPATFKYLQGLFQNSSCERLRRSGIDCGGRPIVLAVVDVLLDVPSICSLDYQLDPIDFRGCLVLS